MATRNTIQGSLVLEAVNALQCHATAEEIYKVIAGKNPSVSRGTVYRNLAKLADAGRIRKIQTPDGPDRYDHRCSDHYHVQCAVCGGVFDVDMDTIPHLDEGIRDAHGFVFTGYAVFFRGLCPDCQAHTGSEKPVNIHAKEFQS